MVTLRTFTYVGSVVIIVFMFVFGADRLRPLAQWLFSWHYEQYTTAGLGTGVAYTPVVIEGEDHVPLLPVAIPPQTPYGTVLARIPHRYSTRVEVPRYVYAGYPDSQLVGSVTVTDGRIQVLELFTSPRSSESYVVNDYQVTGTGTGSGIRFTLPNDASVEEGESLVHAQTGLVAGWVVSFNEVPEKSILEVLVAPTVNPHQTPVYYVAVDEPVKVPEEEVSQIISKLSEGQ